jgi:cellulose synthase/poly-beta-1,6-N-acetylglucosamine synthase-like glycosyltransferase
MTQAIEAVVIALVLVFSFRRGVLLVASLLPPRSLPSGRALPGVTVIVPARNERVVAGRLLESLAGLCYPPGRLSFVLVCDGCTDETPELFRDWAATRRDARVVELPARGGKAAALNAGLRIAASELVVVLDADLVPDPQFLVHLVRPFEDDRVAATAAFLRPFNPDVNITSRYAAVTTWVHQLVTSAGTDRLGLNPPTLGASAYRRAALEQIGGFALVPTGEDVATSNALIRRGWRTRFVVDAIADNTVVAALGEYWRQHVRWTRSLLHVQADDVPSRASLLQRLESGASSFGSADRLVFAVAAMGAAISLVPRWVPVLYLAAPGLEVVVALHKAGVRRRAPHYLLATMLFFVMDIAGSATAVVLQTFRRPYSWHNPRSVPADAPAE